MEVSAVRGKVMVIREVTRGMLAVTIRYQVWLWLCSHLYLYKQGNTPSVIYHPIPID